MEQYHGLSGKNILPVLLLLLLVFAVYGNTLRNEFTNWDDDSLIVNNEQIRSVDWQNIKSIFDFRYKHGTYQPVRVLSYAIDYRIWKLNVVGYHLHNILLHGMASIFLFLGLCQAIPMIYGMKGIDSSTVRSTAFFTAILFAVHPLCVEAVTWLSGRKYTLLTCFSFLAFYLFALDFDSKGNSIWMRSGAILSSLLAVLSSPVGIVLPIFFFSCCYSWDRSNNFPDVMSRHMAKCFPFCLVFLPIGLKFWEALVTGARVDTASNAAFENRIFLLWTMLRVCFDYMRNILMPFWLNIRYPDFVSNSFAEFKVMAGAVMIVATAVLVIRNVWKGNKFSFFCFSWVVIFWLPVSNLIQISTKMADRYIYLSLPGVLLFASFYLCNRLKKYDLKYSNKMVLTSIAFLLVFYFLPFTIDRNSDWANSATLWRSSLKVFPDNAIAHNNLGVHLFHVEKRLDKAEAHFKEALRLMPDSTEPYQNLMELMSYRGKYTSAIAYGKELVRRQPGNPKWYFEIGVALEKSGSHRDAIKWYQKTVALEPGFPYVNYNLAVSYHAAGLIKKSKRSYELELEANPNSITTLNNLAMLLVEMGDFKNAEAMLLKAISINSSQINTFVNLGIVYSLIKKPELAMEKLSKALALNPNDAAIHFLLGKELIKIGRTAEGLQHIERAKLLDAGTKKSNYRNEKN